MKHILLVAASLLVALSASTPVLGAGAQGSKPAAGADFYAHRGGRAENDENTLQAFKQCISIGCDRFETDVRMAADGMLVISHDASLKRRTGFDGRIEEMNGRDIISHKTFIGNNIPSLGQVLKLFKKHKVAYVEWELKTGNKKEYPDEKIPAYCEAVYSQVTKMQPEGTLWVFTSFDERPLTYLRKHHPEVKTGYITGEPVCKATIAKAIELGANQLDASVNKTTAEAVDAAHKAGLAVCLWPGTTTKHYATMKALGADRCCTDAPNLISLEF